MNRKIIFFSLVCYAAALLLPPVLLHAAALRAPNSAPALQGDATMPAGAADTGDILDIYGPLPLAEPFPYLLYGAGLLLLVMLVIALWLFLAYRKKRMNDRKPDPASLALHSLQEAEDGLQRFGIFFFAGEVSRILRSYIEARFSLPATSSTTSEFFSSLETSSGQVEMLSQHDNLLRQCLLLCDRGKFSRFLPEHEAVGSLAGSARNFIEATRPTTAEEG